MKTAKRSASTTRVKTATKSTGAEDPDLAKLSPALRKQAEKLVTRAKSKLVKRGKDAIMRAKAALGNVSRNLWEVGLALKELSSPGVTVALGHGDGQQGLLEAAQKELGLEPATVKRLLDAVTRVEQEQFAKLGLGTVNARLELADATPADDTRAVIAGREVVLWPGGPSVKVSEESDRGLARWAAKTRQWVKEQANKSTNEKRPRGKTTTPEERETGAALATALKRAGIECNVKVRATTPGRASVVDCVGLSMDAAKVLRALVVRTKQPGKSSKRA